MRASHAVYPPRRGRGPAQIWLRTQIWGCEAKRVVGEARGSVCLDITADVTRETRRSTLQELLGLVTGGAARTPPASHIPDLTSEGQISDLGRPVPILVFIF